MPEFTFHGVDRKGKKITGKVDAPTEVELRMILRGQGIRPVKIQQVTVLNADLGSLLRGGKPPKVSGEALAIFTRQLQVLVSSGIPLVQALEVLAEQTQDPGLKKITVSIKDKVSEGTFFWEAMSGFGDAFPKVYISLIRAGESSGALEVILDRLSQYMENSNKLAKMVKSAMIYPMAIVSIGVLVIAAMLVFVIPKFEELLVSQGQALPAPTAFVVNASHMLTDNIMYILGGSAAFIFLALKYAKSEEGKGVVDRISFRLPLIGEIIRKSSIARFTRTLGTLLSSGVNLIDAIDICKDTVDSVVIEEAVGRIRSEIESGKTLGMVMQLTPIFPKMVTQMVSVGESTGNIEKMLERIADIYENEVETLVAGMSKLVEPFILVFLGGSIGGMMIAMYLPIFKLAGASG